MKHFLFGDQYVETRLLMREKGTWHGYSYRWNADQRDAVLLTGSLDADVEGQRWHFPSRSECGQCHTQAAGYTLGLELAQLDHGEAVEATNQMAYLLEHEYLEPEVTSLASLRAAVEPLVDPFGDADLEDRARSYLHANCSGCHRPGALGRGEIDLTYAASWEDFNACGFAPRSDRIWDTDNWDAQRIVAPGRKEDSVLWMRMALHGYFRMPPLASEVIDAQGVALVGAWIDSLTDCER
jgi:mono/diheme cytochrome c family protein